ncbi:hypothetical protein I79_003255 [Cricetulus griseus]|uniref:Uncharacterized protein n=1 Tax=Cricetulus griseus TaxID=10029 RepID=G3GZJ1_CRIGR|nr:hypothetical protein I79_003255 [Cricetulus griseus]
MTPCGNLTPAEAWLGGNFLLATKDIPSVFGPPLSFLYLTLPLSRGFLRLQGIKLALPCQFHFPRLNMPRSVAAP